MGWDISYHPISEKQINEWYFAVLKYQNLIEKLSIEYQIDEFYKEKFKEVIQTGLNTSKTANFDHNHGYYIAVIQGFFQKYFYTRGSALSFSKNPILEKYFKKWNDIIPKDYQSKNVNNKLTNNYSSGVYIPADKVVELIEDYKTNSEINSELNSLFSHNRISIFLKALQFAADHNLGVLEATEVIEPNPMNLNNSACYSNMFNCDPEGAILYQKQALLEIAEIEKKENLKSGEISSKAEYLVRNVETVNKIEKKGFWKKLFSK